jgi:hypothetical protein
VLRAVSVDQAIHQLRQRWTECDTVLQPGDTVKITKIGRRTGRSAVVLDPFWSGRVKVQIVTTRYEQPMTRSYLTVELELKERHQGPPLSSRVDT